jgi:hypothetical protein
VYQSHCLIDVRVAKEDKIIHPFQQCLHSCRVEDCNYGVCDATKYPWTTGTPEAANVVNANGTILKQDTEKRTIFWGKRDAAKGCIDIKNGSLCMRRCSGH